jgi:hypothetical protein
MGGGQAFDELQILVGGLAADVARPIFSSRICQCSGVGSKGSQRSMAFVIRRQRIRSPPSKITRISNLPSSVFSCQPMFLRMTGKM